MNDKLEGRCLGLIGGLGVGATIFYYQELVKAHAALGCIPNLVIVHADVKRVLQYAAARELGSMAEYLAGLVRRLAPAGAKIAAVPSITPHLCAAELARLSPIPLVNLIEEIEREVRAKGLKRVALLGARFAIETKLFGQLPDVEILTPKSDEVDAIHATYMEIVDAGTGREEQYLALREIAHTLCERDGAEAIILAGTELALVFNPGNTDFPHVDSTRLHLGAIMRKLVPSNGI